MFVQIDREEVLKIIRRYGPLLPLEIKKHLGKGDTTIIGATLSELAYHGLVKISKVKRGSSPFYYDPKNPASLEQVAKYLGEKNYRTFLLLKEKKIIRKDDVDPITRVGLSQIKDYSIELKVKNKGEEIIFYQYYLMSEIDAHKKIKELLFGNKEDSVNKKGLVNKEDDSKKEYLSETEFEKKFKNRIIKKELVDDKKVREEHGEAEIIKKELVDDKKVREETFNDTKLQEYLIENKKYTETKNNDITNYDDDPFVKELLIYFNKKNIIVNEYKIIRKKTDINFVLSIPTSIGRMNYFCKAKSKKKSNDGDIASALLAGQQKHLPTIYLTTGEVTKKAKELTKTELKGVIIKEI